MRCDCCNKNLNDWESTLKSVDGDFLNTCNKCIKGLGIKLHGRSDLDPMEAPPSEEWLDVGDPFLNKLETSYFEDD
jgi:hypothetical protein